MAVKEKFPKSSIVFYFLEVVESKVWSRFYVTCIAAKKIYLTELVLQVRFKRATIKNSGSNLTQHASHRNFWNLSTKVGGAAQRKFGAIPPISGVCSSCLFSQMFIA